MYLPEYIGMLQSGEQQLAEAFTVLAQRHGEDLEVRDMSRILASWSRQHAQALSALAQRFGATPSREPEALRRTLFAGVRTGPLGLMRDLQDTWLLGQQVSLNWLVLSQAARALRDADFQATCERLSGETKRQLDWLQARVNDAAPELLSVPA